MVSTMDNEGSYLHIVMFPWLAYGHIIPFFEVSKFLAQKGHRISFLSTPKNTNLVKTLVPANLSSSINLVSIPLPRVDGLPDSVESTAELPTLNKVPYLIKAYDKLEPALTDFFENSHVDWIIFDFLSYWVAPIASRFRVNSACFIVVGASTMAFHGEPNELINGGRFKTMEDFTVVPKWINYSYPSSAAFTRHEVVSRSERMDPDANNFQRFGESILGCQIVTLRTCREFEGEAMSLLEKLYPKPVVPVGLLPRQPQLNELDDENWGSLKKWLDGKEEKSVFYVAFGSEVTLSHESMHELARGIEKSGLPFIWVIRNRPLEDNSDHDIIPSGFEDRVSGRGMVLRGWAPQLSILAHQSVGGFLTHCGWSSVIEGLGLGRVLILFSGASADQGLVARLMSDRRVGLEIPRGEEDGSFTSEVVAETIRLVMVEEEGASLKANAWAMRHIFGNVDLQNQYLDDFAGALEKYCSSPKDDLIA